ncbi:MAG: hypothetical protein ACJASB_000719 [Shewanella psychromarinicola]|jgi:hypothetical protein
MWKVAVYTKADIKSAFYFNNASVKQTLGQLSAKGKNSFWLKP